MKLLLLLSTLSLNYALANNDQIARNCELRARKLYPGFSKQDRLDRAYYTVGCFIKATQKE